MHGSFAEDRLILTAVENHLLDAGLLEDVVVHGTGRVEGLCGQVD